MEQRQLEEVFFFLQIYKVFSTLLLLLVISRCCSKARMGGRWASDGSDDTSSREEVKDVIGKVKQSRWVSDTVQVWTLL